MKIVAATVRHHDKNIVFGPTTPYFFKVAFIDGFYSNDVLDNVTDIYKQSLPLGTDIVFRKMPGLRTTNELSTAQDFVSTMLFETMTALSIKTKPRKRMCFSSRRFPHSPLFVDKRSA